MQGPDTPSATYRAIIDQLVNDTRLRGSAPRVRESGIFSKAPSHREFNEFIGALSERQREALYRMLQEERDGAIHDVLADLSWWIDCRDVGWTVRGEPMPVDQSGMGLHGDYVGRRDGWGWPTDSGEDSSDSASSERNV
jgi:hypothetical protein